MDAINSNILIVEDDVDLALLMAEYLSAREFNVSVEHSGLPAVERIVSEQPDLVVLDLMLPGKDGVAICREARPNYQGRILMLTASEDSIDQIVGLEVGADDFVQKPIEPRVLLARIRALLRRSSIAPEPTETPSKNLLKFRELNINKASRNVEFQQQMLDLTTPEFDMLALLAENAGEIVSREQVFKALKNIEYDGLNRFADITISQIRKKLGDNADDYLKTIRGKGYLFMP